MSDQDMLSTLLDASALLLAVEAGDEQSAEAMVQTYRNPDDAMQLVSAMCAHALTAARLAAETTGIQPRACWPRWRSSFATAGSPERQRQRSLGHLVRRP